jgi:hypothetical protein
LFIVQAKGSEFCDFAFSPAARWGALGTCESAGYAEKTYHAFCYSPVPNDQGNVGPATISGSYGDDLLRKVSEVFPQLKAKVL